MALTSAAKVFDSGKGGSKSFLLDRMTLSVTLEFWCEKEKSINGNMSRKINVDNTEESEWVLERMDGWRDHLLRLKGTVTMRCYGNKCLMCVCRKVTGKSMSFPNGCILIKKGKTIYGWKSFGDIVSTVNFRLRPRRRISQEDGLRVHSWDFQKRVWKGTPSHSLVRKHSLPPTEWTLSITYRIALQYHPVFEF